MTQVKTTTHPSFFFARLFQNSQNRIRTGWKAFLFLLCSVAFYFLIRPFLPLIPQDYRNIVICIGSIGLTWLALKKENRSLASIGFRLGKKWWLQAITGIGLGSLIVPLVILIEGVVFDTSLVLNENFTWPAFLSVVHFMIWAVLFEEVIFRGYAFQNMLKGWGIWPAQLLMAVVFSLYHISKGPLVLVTTFFFAFLFGLAYIRTKSLALPIGLHLGLNLAVASFGANTGTANMFTRIIPDSSPLLIGSPVILLPTVLTTVLCCSVLYLYKRKPSAEV